MTEDPRWKTTVGIGVNRGLEFVIREYTDGVTPPQLVLKPILSEEGYTIGPATKNMIDEVVHCLARLRTFAS